MNYTISNLSFTDFIMRGRDSIILADKIHSYAEKVSSSNQISLLSMLKQKDLNPEQFLKKFSNIKNKADKDRIKEIVLHTSDKRVTSEEAKQLDNELLSIILSEPALLDSSRSPEQQKESRDNAHNFQEIFDSLPSVLYVKCGSRDATAEDMHLLSILDKFEILHRIGAEVENGIPEDFFTYIPRRQQTDLQLSQEDSQ